MSTTSPPNPPPTHPPTGSIGDLHARLQASSQRDQDAIQQAAEAQMQALVEQMQAQLATHVRDWNTHVNAELTSTSAAIGSRLNRIRQDAWTSQRLVRRWLIWPPIAAISLSLLILIGSLALGWSIARGIPATTITNKKGQPIQVLTGTEWTTCSWQGTKHPCRPLEPK
jgi:hypothetical protein